MELNQFRDVDVVLDKANDNIIQKQFVSAGDKDGRSLTVQLTDNGAIGEIIGATLNLYWHNQASGLTDLSAFYVVDKATSVFKIDYPQNMLTPGKVIAYIQILHGGKVTHTKPFEITVQKLAGTTRGVLATAEYGALVTTLAKANEFETDIAKKADKTQVDAQLAQTESQVNSRIDKIISLPDGSTTGDAQLLDGAISADGTDNGNVGTNIRKTQKGEMIMENAISAEKINPSDKSVNIIDPDELMANKYYYGAIGSPAILSSKDGFYGTAEPIPVSVGDVVRYNKARELVAYVGVDNAGNTLQLATSRGTTTPMTMTVIEGVVGVYIAATAENLPEFMVTINNPLPSIYTPKFIKKTLDWLDYKPQSINKEHLSFDIDSQGSSEYETGFEGKKIAWFGTSIDWQDGKPYGGSGSVARGWQTHFEEHLGVTIDNMALSGSPMANGTRWANTTGTGVNRVLAYDDYVNTNYVIINHHTNDLEFDVPIGAIANPTIGDVGTNFDDTTFIGAYQKAIEHIQTQNPNIHIVLVTPLHRNKGRFNSFSKDEDAQYLSLMDYRDAIILLGRYYSAKVIDLTAISGINMNNLDSFMMDGLHPHDGGYAQSVVPFIGEFRTLKPLQ